MTEIQEELVPKQQEGAATDTEESVTLNTAEEARRMFEQVKKRLLHVNDWEKLTGPGTADFQLTDMAGNAVQRAATEGDHFMIDIPGPGPVTGEGYDWVRIESIEEVNNAADDMECITIRVRPATNPKGGGEDVAHFFKENATSNFMVIRKGNTIVAGVYGRNELPNTGAEKAVDKARNTMVALSAMAGASKLQWKSLVKGLING
jgi:hypothetical protein